MAQAWLILDSINRRVGAAAAYGQEPVWLALGERDRAYVSGVQQALQQAGLPLADVAVATVIQGTGGFSDTRAAVLFANTLRWQNKGIKIYEIAIEKGSGAVLPESGSQLAAAGTETDNLKPRYFAEPNITKSSK